MSRRELRARDHNKTQRVLLPLDGACLPVYPRQSFFYFLFAAIIDTPRSHAERISPRLYHAERFPPRTAARQEINLGVDPAISATPGAFVDGDQLPIPRRTRLKRRGSRCEIVAEKSLDPSIASRLIRFRTHRSKSTQLTHIVVA